MEAAIKQWANFIKEVKGIDVELIEYVLDREHSHKFISGKWHIYSFWQNENNQALKIGVAGPRSAARFSSQHYHENSAPSNLAKSILYSQLCSSDAKTWLKTNTYRINVIFNNFSKPLAHALESHLHLLYEPRFEK